MFPYFYSFFISSDCVFSNSLSSSSLMFSSVWSVLLLRDSDMFFIMSIVCINFRISAWRPWIISTYLLNLSDRILNSVSVLCWISVSFLKIALLNSLSERSHISVSPGLVPAALFSLFGEVTLSWVVVMLVDIHWCLGLEELGIYFSLYSLGLFVSVCIHSSWGGFLGIWRDLGVLIEAVSVLGREAGGSTWSPVTVWLLQTHWGIYCLGGLG